MHVCVKPHGTHVRCCYAPTCATVSCGCSHGVRVPMQYVTVSRDGMRGEPHTPFTRMLALVPHTLHRKAAGLPLRCHCFPSIQDAH